MLNFYSDFKKLKMEGKFFIYFLNSTNFFFFKFQILKWIENMTRQEFEEFPRFTDFWEIPQIPRYFGNSPDIFRNLRGGILLEFWKFS